MKKTVLDFRNMKENDIGISMITAYDYPMAQLAERAGVDCILVGDSLGMTVLGYESTVPVTMEDMLHHTRPVCRGASQTFVVADLPFMSYMNVADTLRNSGRLVQEGGADAVKLEGGRAQIHKVRALNRAGIPVVAHIGLTPQTASQLGGFKVQGKSLDDSLVLLEDAKVLQEAGAFMIVLEAVPETLGEKITKSLSIPTIGIGAGRECDGQVLVVHDILGLFERFQPKFVKQYANLGPLIVDALKQYDQEVKSRTFPEEKHCFSMEAEAAKILLEQP
ncbi:MAG: 3-methyl-2-oxobutanoate hydroxymethyltransferase [Peptococcaceae bacterium]|jgi:3-methyl-2-oxobutanoate hydroxymethyltransferase|nr:3-methyl-2-oxobutanoate hydroxymethyltransferase [Peptococcaceae bacterium]